MKKLFVIFLILIPLLFGCQSNTPSAEIVATTPPVYHFTLAVCEGTPLIVSQLISESVSCLHDYNLSVSQVRKLENAEIVVLSGAGLEAFIPENLFADASVIDASAQVQLLCPSEEHDHSHHDHSSDPHIWLSPANAIKMVETITANLIKCYPTYAETFTLNSAKLTADISALETYGKQTLQELSCRSLITFHDGFSYLANAFDLTILESIEEESGSEASAKEIVHLSTLVKSQNLPAIFTEISGSTSAAAIISAETDVPIFTLDMGMAEADYFEAMYHNIDTLKEALK